VETKVPVAATAEQKTLVSIGEGLVTLRTLISYTITSGQMSLFEIEVDPLVKIVHVEGTTTTFLFFHKSHISLSILTGMKNIPVKRWEIVKSDKGEDENNNNTSRKKGSSTLKVFLEYGLEDRYEFTIMGEISMDSSSGEAKIPPFSCLASKDVSRDKGFVAVEAKTNVEVEETASTGIQNEKKKKMKKNFFYYFCPLFYLERKLIFFF
jgi:hypothetical protein